MMWLIPLIGAGVGAITGGLSTWQQGEKEKAALERQKESARQQYLLGKEYSDEMYSIQKSEALNQLGVQRSNLDKQLSNATSEYNASLLSQAFGIQDARIQSDSAIGASVAAEAAGGTRGDAANEMIRAYAAAGLERNIDMQNKQNVNYMDQVITGANLTADAIKREGISWMEGGYRHHQKTSQDAYNENIYKLGQSDYDWAIEQSQPGFLDYFTGVLSGASGGFDLGFGIENTVNQMNLGNNGKYTGNYIKTNKNAWNNIGWKQGVNKFK